MLAAAWLLFWHGGAGSAQETPAAIDWAVLALERLPGLEPCHRPNVGETLLCGRLEVPEDRRLSDGRTISLEIVVVPAQSEDPPRDAVFVLEGGPGGAVTKRAAGLVWSGAVRRRDIVLVDQRGTGGSHPLDCDLEGAQEAAPGRLRDMFPPGAVRDCAERHSVDSDLTAYGSAELADDLEAVRRHLGYDSVDLRGGSYGTDAMMVFAQRYPDSVRTIFGIGWSSPLRSNLSERGVMSERALTRLTVLCDEDPACAGLVPGLGYRVAALLASLDASARTVELDDPQSPGHRLTIRLGRDWLAEQIRLNLYFVFTSRGLPWAVHRASLGDWVPLAEMAVLIERSFRSSLSYGVLLTVQCSEMMAFDVAAALARGSRTLFGNYRLEQQLRGCADWPHEQRHRLGVATPRPLAVPTLMISGYLDPVTPPDYAEEARTLFPNSLHVVLPGGGHGPFDLDNSWTCVHAMWADLIEHADPSRIDTACTEAMTRPPFIVDGSAYRRYLEEVLLPAS